MAYTEKTLRIWNMLCKKNAYKQFFYHNICHLERFESIDKHKVLLIKVRKMKKKYEINVPTLQYKSNSSHKIPRNSGTPPPGTSPDWAAA